MEVTSTVESVGDDGVPEARVPPPPLVVDLDGTLTPTDTLVESFLCLLKRHPLMALHAVMWLLRGRAYFKHRIAMLVLPDASELPYRQDLLRYLQVQREAGRTLILATAADERIAQAVADHLRLFSAVIASNGRTNLKGPEKLAAIRSLVGPEFSYAGDCSADLPVWRAATSAVLVGCSSKLTSTVGSATRIEACFGDRAARIQTWSRALRLHQWLKNLLVFVPLLTAFAGVAKLWPAFVAFAAFCATASATYLVNDLFDLRSDRLHPRKRERPLASGQIALSTAMATAALLMCLSIAMALYLGRPFVAMLAVYVCLTLAYSLKLKQYMLLDVIALAALYTIRILAGGAATELVVSMWLCAFSLFLFLSLALVKRCAELSWMVKQGAAEAHGRGYQVVDIDVLRSMGIAAGMSAIVVFALFFNEADNAARFATPELLWLVALGLIYWMGRLWLKTGRGLMHDDPLVFTIRDKGSLAVLLMIIAVVAAAHFIQIRLGPGI